MNKGHCGRQNCPYSHDRSAILSAALKRIRTQHANGGTSGGAGGANQDNGTGRGRGRRRGNRGGRGRGSRAPHNRGGGKVKTELCKKEGPCPLPDHGDHAQSECPHHLNAIREQALTVRLMRLHMHVGKVFVGNTTATQSATAQLRPR